MNLKIKERRSRPTVAGLDTRVTPEWKNLQRCSETVGHRSVRRFRSEPETWPSVNGRGNSSDTVVPTWKRWLDLSLVLISLPVAIPLLLAVAMWIRMVSRGPALFRQKRIGLGGKVFTLYKFRSMHDGAETLGHRLHVEHLVETDSPMVKLDLMGDSRLITGGCLLRTAGLDELPQLLNVLRGEMSLVGPRPCLPEEYGFFSPAQRERFQVLPGLTGRWQVNGKNSTTFREMNLMDVAYSRTSSPLQDLKIILLTPKALLGQMRQCMMRKLRRGRGEVERMTPYGAQRMTDRV